MSDAQIRGLGRWKSDALLSYTYDRQLRGQIRFVFGYCSHGLIPVYNDQIVSSRQAWAGELPGVHKEIFLKVYIIQSYRLSAGLG